MSERSSYEPGVFCWAELTTPDPDAARAFYAAVLGWDEGFTLDGAEVAGVREGEPAAWVSFVSVQDAPAVAARAAELGGEEVEGRVRDPTGALLGLRQDGGAGRVNEAGCMAWN